VDDFTFDDEPEEEPAPMTDGTLATLFSAPMGDSSNALAEFGRVNIIERITLLFLVYFYVERPSINNDSLE
jgi:hypothetical protein